MIEFNLDAANSILYMRPKSALAEDDFVKIARAVDPHIEATGGLAGVIIEVPAFPGWESLGALFAHFRLVRDHHRQVRKVALVTDSTLLKVIESLASHFVSAEVRRFPSGQIDAAKQWILGAS
jgi:stage II sporulation SpoAA-like protein